MSFQQCEFNFGSRPFLYYPRDEKNNLIKFQSFNDHAVLSEDEKVILPRHKKLEMLKMISIKEDACTLCFDANASVVLKVSCIPFEWLCCFVRLRYLFYTKYKNNFIFSILIKFHVFSHVCIKDSVQFVRINSRYVQCVEQPYSPSVAKPQQLQQMLQSKQTTKSEWMLPERRYPKTRIINNLYYILIKLVF